MGTASDDWKDCGEPVTVEACAGCGHLRIAHGPFASFCSVTSCKCGGYVAPTGDASHDALTPGERRYVEMLRTGAITGGSLAIIDRLAPRPGGER